MCLCCGRDALLTAAPSYLGRGLWVGPRIQSWRRSPTTGRKSIDFWVSLDCISFLPIASFLSRLNPSSNLSSASPLFSTIAMISTLVSLLALSASGAAIDVSAPHYSLYLYDDVSAGSWPSADKVQPYNRLLLAFWESGGPTAASSSWASLPDDKRQSILNDYHDKGIAVMVSAFGAGDSVIGKKKDPVKLAQDLAGWVNQHGLDGVDVDLEDFDSLQNDKDYALDWLSKFYTELSNSLGGKPISSTPTAWMYGSAFGSADSVYCKLNSAVGDKISWYNMQLYNGAQGTWNNCDNTVKHSDNGAFLALGDISGMCGIPMNKMAVGKLWDKGELAHAGTEDQIMDPTALGQCLAGAGTGGVMVWSASLGSWDKPLNYLKDTLGAESSAPAAPAGNNLAVSASPAPSSVAVPALVSPSATSSDTPSAAPATDASSSVGSSSGAAAVSPSSAPGSASNVGGSSSASASAGSSSAVAGSSSAGASSSDAPQSASDASTSSGSNQAADPKAGQSDSKTAGSSTPDASKSSASGAAGASAAANKENSSASALSASFLVAAGAVLATLF